MSIPQLVQFADLTSAHFDQHPVWASCQSFDYGEPWYDDTDEETFRPSNTDLPVSPSDGMYLVRADFVLADGTSLVGFLTPAIEDGSSNALGTIQPQMYLPSGERMSFWLGMFGNPNDQATTLYSALGRAAGAIFPIRFRAPEALATGVTAGAIDGFYTVPDGRTITIHR